MESSLKENTNSNKKLLNKKTTRPKNNKQEDSNSNKKHQSKVKTSPEKSYNSKNKNKSNSNSPLHKNSTDIEENQSSNEKYPKSLNNYIYKNKCRINLKEIDLEKTKIKIPLTPCIKRSKNEKINSPKNNFEMSYIKKFPGESNYVIYIKDKFFIIFDINTGDKIRTQRLGGRSIYNAVIPLTKQRVFTVGADFLRMYHYDLTKKEIKMIDPNNNYQNYDPCIYVKQVTSSYIIMCKKLVCFIYNLQKFSSDKIISLSVLMKFLNGDKNFKNINDEKKLNYNNENKFIKCKVFSKKEFGLCYNDTIFIVSIPEGNIITHFKINDNSLYTKTNKYFKRFTVVINKMKDIKKFYFVWIENLNTLKIFEKNENANKNEECELSGDKHVVNFLSNNNDDIILNKELEFNKERIIFNVKQISNSEIVIILKNNEMLVYNFFVGAVITCISYGKIILDNNYYFFKKIGRGLFLVNLNSKKLGLIEFKKGKILKKFYLEDEICIDADICESANKRDGKINKDIVVMNQLFVYALDLGMLRNWSRLRAN